MLYRFALLLQRILCVESISADLISQQWFVEFGPLLAYHPLTRSISVCWETRGRREQATVGPASCRSLKVNRQDAGPVKASRVGQAGPADAQLSRNTGQRPLAALRLLRINRQDAGPTSLGELRTNSRCVSAVYPG